MNNLHKPDLVLFPRTSEVPSSVFSPILCGLAIGLGQLLFVLIIGWIARRDLPEEQDRTIKAVYRALAHWDSGWYQDIAERGYRVPERLSPENFGNVCFFPGYPLVVRAVHSLTDIDWPFSLLLVSQFACWPMWAYLLLLLRRYDVSNRAQFVVIGLILCHPAAYFFVTGYSESLFLTSFLGMCYWGGRPGWLSFVLAAAHGFMMTSTRIVGLPLIAVPLIVVWFTPGISQRSIVCTAAMASLASLGIVGFFGWCHFRFGRWDTYFLVEEAGWGIRPNYLAPICGRLYSFNPKMFRWALRTPQSFDHLMATFTVISFYLMALSELPRMWCGDSGWRRRLPWYLAAAGLIYVPLAGQFNREIASFTRYSLMVTAPFYLLAADAMRTLPRQWLIPITMIASVGLGYQIHFAGEYILGRFTF